MTKQGKIALAEAEVAAEVGGLVSAEGGALVKASGAGAGSAAARAEKAAALVDSFAPVPRKYRHDGWTPERQRAFIGALAETGCVSRAARMVNIAQTNAYALRRAPGAEGFRRAWDAALDFGLKRLKDVAFERAIEGQLVPVFQAGRLIGFRRVYNDKLLMFCLRHYGQDSEGRRTTINYFSTRSSAGVLRDASSTGSADDGLLGICPGDESKAIIQDERRGVGDRPSPGPSREREGSVAAAEASATTVRTVITGGGGLGGAEADDAAAAALNGFEGVALDAEAEAAIQAALEACAARARAAEAAYEKGGSEGADAAEDDPDVPFFRSDQPYRGTLVMLEEDDEAIGFAPGESHWINAGAEMPEGLARMVEEAERRGGSG